MRFDRGMIKWQPFNSVISSKSIVRTLTAEKAKISKPILSEEEIKQLEEKIIDAYYCQSNVTLHYYKNGYIQELKGMIKKIDHVSKMIYLNSSSIFFQQIISIDY